MGTRTILLATAVLLSSAAATSVAAQTDSAGRTGTPGSAGNELGDTFADPTAERLVLRAREALDAGARGLRSYEARMTERMRVGVSVGPGLTGRGRTLYHRERVAMVWWSATEDGLLRWLGERTGQPAVGDGAATEGVLGLDLDVERELDLRDIRAPIPFDPAEDRLDVLDADFIQPVSGEGLATYRFRSGDTLRLDLPDPDADLTLIEVLVEPRFEAWETVTGSLWFDTGSGRLVRATYRPSGVWDHDVQEPGDLEDLPGILKPAIGRVDHIVLEYGLYEQRWWLPRKLEAQGVFTWGRGLVRMPLQVEWVVRDYRVDEAPSAQALPAPDDVRRGRIGNDRRRTLVYSRPEEELRESAALPDPLGVDESGPFTEEELAPLLERLDAATLDGGAQQSPVRLPAWYWRAGTALRYDRVRGPSLGGERTWTPGLGLAVDTRVRLGLAGPDPTGILRLRGITNADRRPSPGTPITGLGHMVARRPEADVRAAPGVWLSAYHALAEANGDWGGILGAGNSLTALVAGHDDGQYYWASGVEVGFGAGGPNRGASLALFGERHRTADVGTDFSLATAGDDVLRQNLVADDGDVLGVRLAVGVQRGQDPMRGVWVADLSGEIGTGDFEYARGVLTTTLLASTFGLPAALRLSAGTSTEGTPLQRRFHLGGTTTLRGLQGGAVSGGSFAAARVEVATPVAMLRLTGFVDAAWTGPALSLPDSRGAASLGVGGSLLDGLFRMDLARAVAGPGGWRLHLYLDGVL